MIEIATDGACKGNPGPGGWGVAVYEDGKYLGGLSGGEVSTTNNRMELKAFIRASEFIRDGLYDSDIRIYLDSQYVLRGASEWLPGWVKKGFSGVKNPDLWKRVHDLRSYWGNCELIWVKGHSGNEMNEKADELANEGVANLLKD